MLPTARKDDLVVQEMGDEVLVYDLRTDKAICLNRTSALVWRSCDGSRTAAEIAAGLERELGQPVTEELVWFALDQLSGEKLLAEGESVAETFGGLSRREIIKRIGLTTAVALPLISSLVAPPVAYAQSCNPAMDMLPTGCPCTNPSNCLNGNCVGGMCV